MISICRPSTPPAEFLRFATISTDSRMLWPCAAAFPDIGPKAPTLIGSRDCAHSVEREPASATAPSPPPINLRRFVVMIDLR